MKYLIFALLKPPRWFLPLLLGCMLASPVAGQATLERVRGTVERRPAAGTAWQAADADTRLSAGDGLRTGANARARIAFPEGLRQSLRANTVAVVKDRCILEVEEGHVAFRKDPRRGGACQFESSTSVARITGTAGAWIVHADGTSELFILTGQGFLFTRETGRVVKLQAGEVARVDAQGLLYEPRPMSAAERQAIRGDFFRPAGYVGGHLGPTIYGGDRDLNPDNEVAKFWESAGVGFGLEAGYQYSRRVGAGALYMSGHYPTVNTPIEAPTYPAIDQATSSKWRHHVAVYTRYHAFPEARVGLYGQLGVTTSFGIVNDRVRTAIGPSYGFGFETTLSRSLTMFVTYVNLRFFGDKAIDLADPGGPADVTDHDTMTFYSLGLRKTIQLYRPRLR